MQTFEVTNDHILCQVEDNTNYNIECEFYFASDSILVAKYSLSPELIGITDIKVSISFINYEAFQNTNHKSLQAEKSFEVIATRGAVSAVAAMSAATTGFGFLTTVLISVGISTVTGSSMELLWSMTNTEQIIFYFALLDLAYPSDTMLIFSYMGYANFQTQIFIYVTTLIFNDGFFDSDAYKPRFS